MHRRRRSPHRTLALLALAVAAAAACSGDDDPRADEPASNSSSEVSTTTAPEPEWVRRDAPSDCRCADGSDFELWLREDDPERVVLFFQGGGACFTAAMCDFDSGTYTPTADADDDPSGRQGIFDFADPRNPFAGWSMVFVPYCTGDVHLGDTTTEYADGLTVHHKGYPNAEAGLDLLVDTFPDAREVFVTGSSAGGVPSPLFGGLASDRLPDAEVAVLADASGGYPSSALLNGTIGGLWGTGENIPDWPETEGVPAEEYGIPDLFAFAGTHDPDIRMARYDDAWDSVQRAFSAAARASDGGLPTLLDENERLVESAGVDLSVFVAPGERHTILARPELYTLAVEGVSFLDWLTELVEGGVPDDVRCVDCGAPTTTP